MTYNTKQKEKILEILKDNENESMSAKEIIENFNMPKATTYRTLESLFENKIINRYYNEHTNAYEYQYISPSLNCNFHLHLKCDNCGKIYHLYNNFGNNMPFIINFKSSVIHGKCVHCEVK